MIYFPRIPLATHIQYSSRIHLDAAAIFLGISFGVISLVVLAQNFRPLLRLLLCASFRLLWLPLRYLNNPRFLRPLSMGTQCVSFIRKTLPNCQRNGKTCALSFVSIGFVLICSRLFSRWTRWSGIRLVTDRPIISINLDYSYLTHKNQKKRMTFLYCWKIGSHDIGWRWPPWWDKNCARGNWMEKQSFCAD